MGEQESSGLTPTPVELRDLMRSAVVVEAWERHDFEWINRAGEKLASAAEFKREPTAADFEFICSQRNTGDADYSIMARRVHRQVRFVDGQRIPLEQAEGLCPTLLAALCSQLNKMESPLPKS